MPRNGRSRRHEFLETALKRFARDGYHATSTRDICADLEIVPSAMYNYFKNKEDVLFEIIIAARAHMQHDLDALLAKSAGNPIEDRVVATVRYIFECAIGMQDAWRLAISEIRGLKPDYLQEVVARRDYFEGRIQSLISEGIKTGAWPDTDATLASNNLFSMAEGIARRHQPSGPYSEEQIVAYNTDFFMNSLKASGQSTDSDSHTQKTAASSAD